MEPLHQKFNAPSVADLLSAIARRYVDADKVAHIKATTIPEIRRILADLDPYSDYWTPEEYTAHETRASGSFFGIAAGLTTDPETNFLKVIAVKNGGPAEKAGLLPGDLVIEINGLSTLSMPIITAMREVDGKEGTSATLAILREGEKDPRSISIPRQKISIERVKFSKIADVGYIKLKDFNSSVRESSDRTIDVARLVRDAIMALEKDNVAGYVLDLRNNLGGLTEQAVKIANYFLGEEKLVATERGRTFRDTLAHETTFSPDITNGKPLIVLVNQKSASASELLAGALQDHRRGTIMGHQTYGKGSVQSLYGYKDGSALKITTSRYCTPNGHEVQGVGITPDIAFENNPRNSRARCGPIIENLPPEELTAIFGRAVVGQNDKIDWMLVSAIETLQNRPKWTITMPCRAPV